MGGVGEALAAIGAAIGEGAATAGGAVAEGAAAAGSAVAEGAATVGGAIGEGASAVGGAIADGAAAVGDFAADFGKSMFNQAFSNKGWGDVVSYDAEGMTGVVSDSADGLTNVTEFTAPDGTTSYIGDIAPDVNWASTLGSAAGQIGKQALLGTVRRSRGISKAKNYLESGNPFELLSDDSKIKKYAKLISGASGM